MTKTITKNIKNVISDKYLSYAISTIISRSLPDVRDGLKPVHRRIIYSMHELKLKHNQQYKKCARIVGDVMGKFHPHGDQAIYESLVRMAQNFSTRYPLIDGQGNFGSIDGDNAAAMRYTEARLDSNAEYLLEGLEEDAVDFISNYDGQNIEPSVLPSFLPNILLNGSSGIAVGMATNIPPHNVFETCLALIELIKDKNISNKKLLKFLKGPDLPTGGKIQIDKENLKNIYDKGKGSFLIKSRWRIKELGQGKYNIEIYEIPYQVNKNKLIENIANLIRLKKIPLEDIWDDSDEKIRIILKPKNRNVPATKLMDVLFNVSDLSVKYFCNYNVLVKGKIPQQLGLKDILKNFLDHRKITIKRVSLFNIEKIKKRINILNGYLIAYKNLNKIIKIIRYNDNPQKELKNKLKLNDIQSFAILDMKLRSLRKIEEKQVQNELNKLKKDLNTLNRIVKNKSVLDKYIIDKLNIYLNNITDEKYSRKTKISLIEKIESNYSIADFTEIENITLTCSESDNIKVYKGHVKSESISFGNNEDVKFYLHLKSNSKLIFITNDGRKYQLNPSIFPSGKSNGTNFSFFANLEKNSKILGIYEYKNNFKCILVSKFSKGFIYSSEDDFVVNKNGKKIFNLKNNDKIIKCIFPYFDYIASINENKKILIFKTDELPILKKGSGVLIQKIKNCSLVDLSSFNKNDGITWSYGKQIKVETNISYWVGKRGQVGKKIPKKFNKNLKFYN